MSSDFGTEARNERTLMVNLLEDRWSETYPNRVVDVPQPTIIRAGAQEDGQRRAQNYSDTDIIHVRDGGNPDYRPASIGFRDMHAEQVIDVEIRTSHSSDRLFGIDEEEYGGLAGEVQRIVDAARYGVGPYDYVWYDTFSDQTEDYGADTWHGTWPVRFIAYSSPISQSGDK